MRIAAVAVYADAGEDAPHVELADAALRMRGSLAAASALSLALATFTWGRLTSFYGERTYLAMASLVLALASGARKRWIAARSMIMGQPHNSRAGG